MEQVRLQAKLKRLKQFEASNSKLIKVLEAAVEKASRQGESFADIDVAGCADTAGLHDFLWEHGYKTSITENTLRISW